jgi:hypothetical protein
VGIVVRCGCCTRIPGTGACAFSLRIPIDLWSRINTCLHGRPDHSHACAGGSRNTNRLSLSHLRLSAPLLSRSGTKDVFCMGGTSEAITSRTSLCSTNSFQRAGATLRSRLELKKVVARFREVPLRSVLRTTTTTTTTYHWSLTLLLPL